MKLYNRILFLICLTTLSCKSQNNLLVKANYNPKAVELSNLSLKVSGNRNTCNKDSILKSINLLEQAITLDSSYYLAYANEAQMFCRLKEYNKAIDILNRYLNISISPGQVEIETFRGFIFEEVGNVDSATIIYKHVIKEYDKKIENDSSNLSSKINRAFLFFFTEGDNKAKMEYKKISDTYPNNEQVKGMKEVFYSFERKSYISGLFSDCAQN